MIRRALWAVIFADWGLILALAAIVFFAIRAGL